MPIFFASADKMTAAKPIGEEPTDKQDEFSISRGNNLLFHYCYLSYPPKAKNATTRRGVQRIF
jgi:hypothetical protein